MATFNGCHLSNFRDEVLPISCFLKGSAFVACLLTITSVEKGAIKANSLSADHSEGVPRSFIGGSFDYKDEEVKGVSKGL